MSDSKQLVGERNVVLSVDLTNSKLGPAWKSVEVTVAQPAAWSEAHLRDITADHYGVPFAQVGKPRPA